MNPRVLLLALALSACNYDGLPDGGPLPAGDLPPLPPDLAEPDCVTSVSCQARDAEFECGVPTAEGRRHPDRGAPYCKEKLSRQRCSCAILRCTSDKAVCPGTYEVAFRQRLLAGCDGKPGEYSGTCLAAWNVVESPQGVVLSERQLYNTDLSWDFTVQRQVFTLTAMTPLRLTVSQYCWMADVQGVGNAGLTEVSSASLKPPQP